MTPRGATMHRFFFPVELAPGGELALPKDEAHHAADVLRLRVGEKVGLLDGRGHEHTCEVLEVARRTVRLRVLETRLHPPPPFEITLFQCVVKGRAMDNIIQKATELGVQRIVPVLAERTVSHLDDDRAETRVEKWRAVAVEAVKQCGNPWLPRLGPPQSFTQCLAAGKSFDLSLVAALDANARSVRRAVSAASATGKEAPRCIALWIGPEGDFTPAEMAGLLASGAQPVTLGPLVLRADTAAIAALAVLQHELRAH
jgi:16S rRNA (uracil1498-N3)-methyltransferase